MTVTAAQLNLWTWAAFFITWNTSAFFTNKTRWRESGERKLHYILPMAAGFALIFHSLFDKNHPRPAHAIAWTGTALTIAGIAFASWARWHLGRFWSGDVTLKEDHRLIRTGPYRVARHPLYAGFLTAVLGSAITAGPLGAYGGFALMLVGILIKIHREEELMGKEFGDEYAQYRRETARLVPFVY